MYKRKDSLAERIGSLKWEKVLPDAVREK